jgi:tetratricopeptide (TPR) repeat protein
MLNWFKRKTADRTPGAQTVKRQGDEHVKAGRYADAERCYREVSESDVQYPDALVMLGFVLREQGRTNEAREILERAVRIADASADAHYLLGSVLAADEKALALASCKRALTLNPGMVVAQQCLSRLWLDTEQFEQAEASYRREIELTPEHFGPYHMLGC